ncbi:hypothetical protein VD0002_g8515 [Verticillium dahliae]|uniref:Uncharacterized protein n=2 Tax=Verticillium dahliae TaxID=27337 RepID=G2XJN1_VERDV|nr:uncharacterized protein VDAG_10294 [Verticillium dahliae VdLs.17]EGY20734.1 hypothetical protein VDAG_10294 [Verticillium dahliae VdLs.17]KAH6708110.1 hypothetical protein EV126DRAFT_104771 [Verticillium dahliae]PNH59015.1 hypothetical protein VD0002_g8515 [Verticillium dahliae]
MAPKSNPRKEVALTLDNVKRSKVFDLNIRSTYTQFNGQEAFRELVQNWRDEVIRASGLSPQQFMDSVTREITTNDSKVEILYKAITPAQDSQGAPEVFGFIRYKGENGQGTVELTNRKSTLQLEHLEMGGTSKRHATNQAGTHGEGMKLAALSMLRPDNNHSVQCVSGGCTWTFYLNSLFKLCVKVERMPKSSLHQIMPPSRRLKQTHSTCVAVPHEDVQFLLGASSKNDDQTKQNTQHVPITKGVFESWTSTALFLQEPNPQMTITTSRGKLLLEPKYHGKLYLKGLLLSHSAHNSASISGKQMRYGYDFADGSTNRDRLHVATAAEEAATIASIWAQSIEQRPEMIDNLSDMLLSETSEYADVNMADRNTSFHVATRLKAALVEKYPNRWFFDNEQRTEYPELELTIQGLGLQGMFLPKTYWKLLHKQGLVREVCDEEAIRFGKAKALGPKELPQTYFAQELYRIIKACMHDCHECMHRITLLIVDAGELKLDTAYRTGPAAQLKVHVKWLSHDILGTELGTRLDKDSLRDVGRIARLLFKRLLQTLPTHKLKLGGKTWQWKIRQLGLLADQRIDDATVFGSTRVFPEPAVSQGVVVRSHFLRELPQGTSAEIHLHGMATCGDKRSIFCAAEVRHPRCTGPAGSCRRLVVSEPRTGVTFENLDLRVDYFALVYSANTPGSFVHVSCGSTKPSAFQKLTVTTSHSAPVGGDASKDCDTADRSSTTGSKRPADAYQVFTPHSKRVRW